jgi:septum formation protein
MLRLVLASASPRRSQLLRDLGLCFQVAPTHAEEPAPTPDDGRSAGAYVERLARLKAAACSEKGLIIAADTTVVLRGQIMNKPRDEEDALAMLRQLQGQTHEVFTGVCLRRGDEFSSEHERTRVTFGAFEDEFLRAYIATGEPLDKAGAYGAQGRGALLIERIEGDYWNVVGLPVFRLAKMLGERGVSVEQFWNKESATKS